MDPSVPVLVDSVLRETVSYSAACERSGLPIEGQPAQRGHIAGHVPGVCDSHSSDGRSAVPALGRSGVFWGSSCGSHQRDCLGPGFDYGYLSGRGTQIFTENRKRMGGSSSKDQEDLRRCGWHVFFALAGSHALSVAGFGADTKELLGSLSLPAPVMVLLVGGIITLAAGPMNASATIVALGAVSYSALVEAGIAPLNAVAAILLFASTEGASPPSSAPIFISCSIAGIKEVTVTFKPLICHYVFPIVGIGILIAYGFLPIAGG